MMFKFLHYVIGRDANTTKATVRTCMTLDAGFRTPALLGIVKEFEINAACDPNLAKYHTGSTMEALEGASCPFKSRRNKKKTGP